MVVRVHHRTNAGGASAQSADLLDLRRDFDRGGIVIAVFRCVRRIAVACALLLAVLAIILFGILWLRGPTHLQSLALRVGDRATFGVMVEGDRAYFIAEDSGAGFGRFYFEDAKADRPAPSRLGRSWHGFAYYGQPGVRALQMPAGAPVLACAAATVGILRFDTRRRRRRKPQRGCCPACGYDLRATPERCPECGAAATSAS